MGAYLSSPICDKDTIEGSNNRLAFAASSMQGWRMSQEDAHNAILDFDGKTSFFAVYDGHGGAEIALYCSRHFPDFLKQLDSYRKGQLNDALIEGFLKFDSLLLDTNVKEILQVLADSKDKNDNDEQMDDQTIDDINLSTNKNEENNHNEELNIEEAQLLKKEAELPIEELLKRYGDDGKYFQSPVISKNKKQIPLKNDDDDEKIKNLEKLKELRDSEVTNEDNVTSSSPIDTDQIKSDVITHADEENIPTDDVLDRKIAETTSNGELSDATEVKPSSSESKTTSRRPRKSASNDTTILSSTTATSKSLTHHLLSDNIDELEDEDDFEYEESEDETSGDEAEDNEDDDENVVGEEDKEEEEEQGTEEEEEEEDKQRESSKAVEIKKLMKKSIMAILNRHTKKRKHNDDSEDDVKENQNEEQQEEDADDNEDEDEEDIDDENDTDLGKMLDMNSDPGSSSGCTAVVTLLRDKQLFVANAGDSRCVVCRNGRAIEMSIDHKPEDPQERARIEKAGYKVTLDGRVSGGLNLSRAIGDHAYKKTSKLPPEEQAITALPDIRTLTLEDQDEFMVIACDGIWNFMSSQDVVDFVRTRLEKKTLSQICEELFTHCLAPNTSGDGTGCDNMTAIIVKFNFNSQSTIEINQESTVLKSTEHSPWPTMFTSVNNKRSLSPEHALTKETNDDDDDDDDIHSKKFKITPENVTNNTVTSPSKTTGAFSFNVATTTNNNNNKNNNLNDDQQH
ncbi:unnamed protein product [Rotaria sordida]|uniref:protein-serine/threonine phosphatase n=1 Tax=Rotaria sordida TaxID=392033 RepID=A0A819M2W4_9BILA|nr:unnamed protein product [Rotaria sordida]